MNNDIYHVDFTQIFPTALQHDPKMLALAQGFAAEALEVSGHLNDVLIYSRFDELPEALVDILAYDMHVDWYDYDMPLKVKREVVKNSVRVHKRMGTKYAVETALGSVWPGSEVEEWFEYGGKPYCFRVKIPITGSSISENQQREGSRKIWFYKNLRSHLDSMEYVREAAKPAVLYLGGAFGAQTTLPVPEGADEMKWLDKLRVGGTAALLSVLPVPELT